jgi:hypothetical protein
MQTLVVSRSWKTLILCVELVESTEKALKFQVVGNKKCHIFLPKRAVTEKTWQGFTDYTVAHWFTGNEFFWNMFERYGDQFKA